jgi:D-alanyl-D-alanine carboxypeptidase/D-alanyl-D-alanine-endopeptidase (penicillin-binding protein 4)
MRSAGPAAGAWVYDATDGRRLYSLRGRSPRVLASNTKLFTTAALLERLGPTATFTTRVSSTGALDAAGTWSGDLVLRGGGDPTFGSGAFATRNYLAGGGTEDLAAQVLDRGVRRVQGRVVADESLFDSLRGGPDSRYGVSRYVGPLSALTYDRARAPGGGSSQNPPLQAAFRLDTALERIGVRVTGKPRLGPVAPGTTELAAVTSPPLARLVEITNVRSDNFFSEVLLKHLSAGPAAPGTTAGGAREAGAVALERGATAQLVDGSGLSRANRASPEQVARLLDALRGRPTFASFYDSLPVAGREGTLRDRLRSAPARGRCRAKTGSLSGVSALSGYCEARGGDLIVFSILMERVNVAGARRLQDRMVQALAGYAG